LSSLQTTGSHNGEDWRSEHRHLAEEQLLDFWPSKKEVVASSEAYLLVNKQLITQDGEMFREELHDS
jgi:hypothetical protein